MSEKEDLKTKEKKEAEKFGQVSRREFLKDAGLVAAGATIGSMALLNACGGGTATETVTAPGGTGATTTVTVTSPPVTKEVSAAAQTIKLTVNGYNYELAVEPEWTLQNLLHDELGWIGIKDMCCGHGACGSCTAIVNKRPILTCMAFAMDYDGATIETAEGLANAKHPLIEAYSKNYCMQCGYCTPGFVVTAKALLDKNPSPTKKQIIDALSGNLCRCGTYPMHPIAVLEAAAKLRGGA